MIKGIYIATYSERALEVIRENGFGIELDDLCVSEMLDGDRIGGTLRRMKREIKESAAKDVIVHGPFTEIVPSSMDHRAADMGLKRLDEAYNVCRELNVNRMVVHSGYFPPLYFKEWHTESSVRFWTRYMDDKPGDFSICIENVLEDEPVMLRRMMEKLKDQRISLCLDVGHANWSTNAEYEVKDWIRVLGGYITHFHLHNNNGKEDLHEPILSGTADMENIMEAMEKYCERDVTVTAESRVCDEDARWLKDRVEKQGGIL